MPKKHSSLSVVPGSSTKTQASPSRSKKSVMNIALPSRSLKKTVLAREANASLTTKDPPKCAFGFLLMDSSLNLISSKVEATRILSYPDKLANLRRQELYVRGKIRSTLMSQQPLGESPFVTEFRSGKRHYFCRAFLVDSE